MLFLKFFFHTGVVNPTIINHPELNYECGGINPPVTPTWEVYDYWAKSTTTWGVNPQLTKQETTT